jgi:hypothetical protein
MAVAAVGGAMDAGGVSPDAAGSVRAELAKFAGAGSVQVVRACRNGGRVDAMLAGPRWAVVATLDGQDRVTSLWVQREPTVFAGAPGGLVVVLNGPSSSGKSTLATVGGQPDPGVRPGVRHDSRPHPAAEPGNEAEKLLVPGPPRRDVGSQPARRRRADAQTRPDMLLPSVVFAHRAHHDGLVATAEYRRQHFPGRDLQPRSPHRAMPGQPVSRTPPRSASTDGTWRGYDRRHCFRLVQRLRPARNHVVRVSPNGVTLVLARPDAEHLSSGPRLRRRCEGRNTSGPGMPAD